MKPRWLGVRLPASAFLALTFLAVASGTALSERGPAEQAGAFRPACAEPRARNGPLTWEVVKVNLLKEWKELGYRTIELDSDGRCAVTRQGKIEDHADAIPRIQKYFRAAKVWAESDKEVACDDNPWSAAFISWVMVESGAVIDGVNSQTDRGQFCPHIGHAAYVWHMARQDRLSTVIPPAFKVHRAQDRAPQIGDLICASRWRPGFDYGHYLSAENQVFTSHCDIVVAIHDGKLHAIGGNVQDGVTRTIVQLKGGKLKPDDVRAWKIVVEAKYTTDRTPMAIPSDAAPDGTIGLCYRDRLRQPQFNCPVDSERNETTYPLLR